MHTPADRPNWIAIVNIQGLARAANQIGRHFTALETRPTSDFLRAPRTRQRRKPL